MPDKAKIVKAIDHMKAYYHTVDNLLYHSTPNLVEKLAEIQDSIDYLEELEREGDEK